MYAEIHLKYDLALKNSIFRLFLRPIWKTAQYARRMQQFFSKKFHLAGKVRSGK